MDQEFSSESKSAINVISISIRDFAVPVPRVGSIEALSGFSRAAQEGLEIHQAVQSKRLEAHANYRSEVSISHRFEREGFTFEVRGRMDGIFDGQKPKIEEIKTAAQVRDLVIRLKNFSYHPYQLQLKTYGYFYWLQHQVLPELSFHIVSTRSSEVDDLKVELDLAEYETWLGLRLDELVKDALIAKKRSKRRRSVAEQFKFPFERPRKGQVDLIEAIEKGLAGQARMMIQAPTGLGKTVGVLYPSLKDALSRGQSVIYVTPKNSQHAVAEDAVERFQDQGSRVKSLTITAKSKLCFKNEPLCNPDYCEYAKDHYTKVAENDLLGVLHKKRRLSAKTFLELGEKYQVCPFELQFQALQEPDVVICDYNYVFSPRSVLGESLSSSSYAEGQPNLVIDEAHNLPSRAMDYYSPALSSVALEKIREDLSSVPKRLRSDVDEEIDQCIAIILGAAPKDANGAVKVRLDPEPFFDQDLKLRGLLSRYLDSGAEVQPKDPIIRLCFYWSEFCAALESALDPTQSQFFTSFHPLRAQQAQLLLEARQPTGGMVKITCCDASEYLKDCYLQYQNVVAFSATIKPFDFYLKLSGLSPETTQTLEFSSPFDPSQRKVMIIPQISTKYSSREANYPKIAEVIRRVISVKPGNYFAFFPSFEFLSRVLNYLDVPSEFDLIRQERDMKTAQIQAVLDHLKGAQKPTLVLAVQGGVFSEGVDYPGDMLIGAFIVGPPLPHFDLEREEMRKYYQEKYQSGFDYAYTYPAMAKSIQSAGRVIRSESDRGTIILMDQRFLQPSFSRTMPSDWYQVSASELVSKSILKDIADFWGQFDG